MIDMANIQSPKIHKFALRMKHKNKIQKMHMVSGDQNSDLLVISLEDSKDGYKVEPFVLQENSIVTVVFLKEDGNVVAGQAEISGVNEIQYLVKGNEITFPGIVEAQVQVYGADSRLSSWDFSFNVKESLDDGDSVESTTEYHVLTSLITDVVQINVAEALRVEAENTRVSNEDNRKTSELQRIQNESDRVLNETSREEKEDIRGIAEASRISQESSRSVAEQARSSAESIRLDSESSRVDAENIRSSNETTRINSEDARVDNEDLRIQSENSRKFVESARVSNESDRESSESTRESNENIRQAHEDSRILAEEDRVNKESLRVTAESERVIAESSREDAEDLRNDAEILREQSEVVRQSIFEDNEANRQEIPVKVSDLETDLNNLDNQVDTLEDDFIEHKNDYATYLESELGEEHIIRSLPNGTKDEIRVGEKKFIKRVKEYVLQENDFSTLTTNKEFIDYVTTRVLSDYIIGNVLTITGNVTSTNSLYREAENTVESLDSVDDINKIIKNMQGSLVLTLPKGVYKTLTEARLALVGTTLIYQLATPIETPLPNPMSPNTREIVRLSEKSQEIDLKANKEQEAWITPTLLNGWVSDVPIVQYRKYNDGLVQLRGIAKAGVAGSTLFTLPVGYRPNGQHNFIGYTSSGQALVIIYADGRVIINNYTNWVYLNQISFGI